MSLKPLKSGSWARLYGHLYIQSVTYQLSACPSFSYLRTDYGAKSRIEHTVLFVAKKNIQFYLEGTNIFKSAFINKDNNDKQRGLSVRPEII